MPGRAGFVPPRLIEEGVRVRLKNVREPARVRRLLGNERIEVEAGFMKMQVSTDDVIEVLPEAAASDKLPKGVKYTPAPELAPLHQEINVIGQRAEEARDAVDEFLDRAVMATASRVRIVHGHGMGVLKKTIAELLSHHPHVAKFYAGAAAGGRSGGYDRGAAGVGAARVWSRAESTCTEMEKSMVARADPLKEPVMGAARRGSAAAATATCESATARPCEGSNPRQPPPRMYTSAQAGETRNGSRNNLSARFGFSIRAGGVAPGGTPKSAVQRYYL